jgi:hypothetical protein
MGLDQMLGLDAKTYMTLAYVAYDESVRHNLWELSMSKDIAPGRFNDMFKNKESKTEHLLREPCGIPIPRDLQIPILTKVRIKKKNQD